MAQSCVAERENLLIYFFFFDLLDRDWVNAVPWVTKQRADNSVTLKIKASNMKSNKYCTKHKNKPVAIHQLKHLYSLFPLQPLEPSLFSDSS